MKKETIDKTKIFVIPTFVILLIIGVAETMMTSNEFGMSDLILGTLLIPIIILSIAMSTYWILLTDDFWNAYEQIDIRLWTKIKTILKFLIWIPGMGLYFFAVTQGLLSIYNRTVGEQNLTVISGQIIDKDEFTSKGTTRYYFEINDTKLGRKIEIKVDDSEFNRFDTGDIYSTERTIGALGLIYETK